MKLHIDIETYSSEDLKKTGAYRYFESLDFEILLIGYAFEDQPVQLIDLAQGEEIPEEFLSALLDPSVTKLAHNATFERMAFKTLGYEIPVEEWECTQIKAAYHGFPHKLAMVSEALGLGDKSKIVEGKILIDYFCKPQKKGPRKRNFPRDDKPKWELFRKYCIRDVEAEREIDRKLPEGLPDFETELYRLDQKINDRGIKVDLVFAKNAIEIDQKAYKKNFKRMKEISGIPNPGSVAQIRKWLGKKLGREITSLARHTIDKLLTEIKDPEVREMLELRAKTGRISTKKYETILRCACQDERARGLFQFYGANRTGRWAGRLIQLQNLPQNHLSDIHLARDLVLKKDEETLKICYEDPSSILSQLVRTALIPKPGHKFVVADFSAIEARVLAWLAKEHWRLKVFRSHGKIYEASASIMFGVPMESVTKGSDLRQKGKVAELALGYGGSVGALTQMTGHENPFSLEEMKTLVRIWRRTNPAIVQFWKDVESLAIRAVETSQTIPNRFREIGFRYDGKSLRIQLPSGKELFYQGIRLGHNRFSQKAVFYKGVDQGGNNWVEMDTYGGKLTENIVQAVSRDVLGDAMLRVEKRGYRNVMHVHDEIVCEVPEDQAEFALQEICQILDQDIPWAVGLPNKAEGFITDFYMKD